MERERRQPGSLGQRIRALRRRRQLSQRELARQAGVAHTTIADLERGDRQDVSTQIALQISRALNTSLDYLTGRFEEESEDDHSSLVIV